MKKIASILLTLALVCVTVLGTGTTVEAYSKEWPITKVDYTANSPVNAGDSVEIKFVITENDATYVNRFEDLGLVLTVGDGSNNPENIITRFNQKGETTIFIIIPEETSEGTIDCAYKAVVFKDGEVHDSVSQKWTFKIQVKAANRKPDLDPKEEEESEYYVNPLRDILTAAVDGGWTDTIQWNEGTGLPDDVMKKLYENPTLSLNFKFTYKDVEHEVYIAPGQAVCDDTAWYGPEWLLGKYGEKGAGGEYTVVKDDNLNALAAKFNTTVEELLKKNPFITDKNLIYPGQVIKY